MADKKKKSFIVYTDREKQVDMLTDEQAGQLFKSLFAYVRTGEEPNFENGMLSMAFSIFQSAIDENNAKYDEVCRRNAENGAKGGRPKKEDLGKTEKNPKNPVGFYETQNNPEKANGFKKTLTDTDTDTDTDTGTGTGTDTDTGTGTDTDTKTDTEHIESDAAFAAPPTPKKEKEVKHKFGEYSHVRLTDSQYHKLCEEYGESRIKLYIKKVDEYCQQVGKTYKDYNLTIRNWMNKDNIQKKQGTTDVYDEYERNQDLPF